MEILDVSLYPEYEQFCLKHPQGCFTQSTRWYGVKNNWQHEVVVSRNAEGAIVGGISVLIQKIPLIGTSFLYAPRGPVCDL
ncbi:MAG: aminoacyltransferase, partial [Oscillospiraceae bacterium]|nr:aminoacyltransferase [Oscillospiraceae bacterium]